MADQDQPVFQEFLEIIERLGLTDAETAVVTRLAPHTVRVARLSRRPPTKHGCTAKIAAFVELNREAKKRQELKLCA